MPRPFDTTADYVSAYGYPGRGLLIGTAADGIACAAYWLTGRSPASQQRRFRHTSTEVVVEDTSGGPVDDLRHYTAAVAGPRGLTVGNGTQVTDVAARIDAGDTVEGAMRAVGFEPDPPIFTPRIVAGARVDDGSWRDVVVASANHDPRWPDLPQHLSLHLTEAPEGLALAVTTYAGDGSTPERSGQPLAVPLDVPAKDLAALVWENLPADYRVGVIVLGAAAEVEVIGLVQGDTTE